MEFIPDLKQFYSFSLPVRLDCKSIPLNGANWIRLSYVLFPMNRFNRNYFTLSNQWCHTTNQDAGLSAHLKKKKKKSSAGMDFQLSLCFEKLIWAMWLLAGSWHMSLTGCFVFFFFHMQRFYIIVSKKRFTQFCTLRFRHFLNKKRNSAVRESW